MNRMFDTDPFLRPMHAGGVLAGPAITVKTRPADNLMVHKAIAVAGPGDVVVVDAGGDLTNATIGELMIAFAEHRGLGGMVINGAIRDSATIRGGRLPVFAAGVNLRGPFKDGPGEINVPIAISGMVIHSGDLVLGGGDGLVCVRHDEAEEIYERAYAKHAGETKLLEAIRSGSSPFDGIDEALEKVGCSIET